jgi:4-hydroxybenzoate polyprenyltransferase
MKIIKKASAVVKSMRPETWFLGSMPIIFMGLIASDFKLNFQTIYGIISLVIIIVILLLGGTNMFNEVFDTEADRINKPQRSIVSGKISKNSALIISLTLMTLGVVWSYFLNFYVFLICLTAFAFGILYSLPHARLKDFSITSMITLGVGYGFIIPISSWFLFKEWNNLIAWLIILMSFSWFFGVTNSKDFKDIPGDKLKGTKTLVILIGEKRTINVMIVLMTFIPCSLLILYVIAGIFPLGTLLALIPNIINFYYLGWLKKHYSPENAFRYYKWVYIIYPLFFVFLAIGFWLGGYIV